MEVPVFLPASQILARLLTVDSDSSGLNANTLQGYVAADFALAAHTHSYQASNANLTALSGLTGAADKVNYFTGAGAMALADFTTFGRSLAGAADAAAGRTALALGTMATQAETAYALLAGRAGGQTLYGGNAANNDLILDSTSHATKTTAYVILQPNGGQVGIGGNPTAALEVITNLANGFQVRRSDNRYFYIGAASAARMEFGAYNASVPEYHPIRLTGKTIEWIVGAGGATGVMLLSDTGVSLGHVVAAAAWADIAASTAARASLRIRSGTWPTAPNDGEIGNDGNAINVMVNGTNAVNTDGGIGVYMQSSTDDRPVGRVLWRYTDKTDASRATEGALTAWYTSTERKAIRWAANSTATLLGFHTTAPIAKPTITGSRGANAALADLLTQLANYGLIIDSTTV